MHVEVGNIHEQVSEHDRREEGLQMKLYFVEVQELGAVRRRSLADATALLNNLADVHRLAAGGLVERGKFLRGLGTEPAQRTVQVGEWNGLYTRKVLINLV